MPSQSPWTAAMIDSFESNQQLAERAIAQVSDEKLRIPLDQHTNSIAVIMKHVSGNLHSRWTDFLVTDGEKPWRDRDDEFVDTFNSRQELLDHWQQGWNTLFTTLASLQPDDLSKTVAIRGEPHSVPLAMTRSFGHTCYHVGQIVHIARIHAGDVWETLTIPKGKSAEFNQANWVQDDGA